MRVRILYARAAKLVAQPVQRALDFSEAERSRAILPLLQQSEAEMLIVPLSTSSLPFVVVRLHRRGGVMLLVAMLLVVSATPRGFAQQSPPDSLPSISLPAEFNRVLRDYEKAWQARNPEALAALFTEDGFVLSNGKPPVRGHAAIRAAYADAGGPLALRAFAYSAEGSVGYIIGAYAEAATAPDTGKFILALRKTNDGRWLIAADIDNTNRRPRAPAPAPPPAQ